MIHSDFREIREERRQLVTMSYPEFLSVQEKRKITGERMPCPKFFLEVRMKFYAYLALSHSKDGSWYLFRKAFIIYNMISLVLKDIHGHHSELFIMDNELKQKCRNDNKGD